MPEPTANAGAQPTAEEAGPTGAVSAALVTGLARLVDCRLAPGAAAELAPLLASSLAALRGLEAADFDNLVPAVVFRAATER